MERRKIETAFGYDASGNQEWVRDPKGQTTFYRYDEQNRRYRTDLPAASASEAATSTQTEYDGFGRRTAEIDQAGRRTGFGYDLAGRLTSVTQSVEGRPVVTTYGYDELGNRIWQKDANGHQTSFEYDKLGRETARILPDGSRETKEYWPDGQLKARTDFMGRRTTYDYEPDTGRLSAKKAFGTDGTEITSAAVGYTYTDSGRRSTVVDARGTTTYGYDGRDRIASLSQPAVGSPGTAGQLEYRYDLSGNRVSLKAIVAGQTLTTSYTYDEASRLDLVTDPLGRVYDHGYDANGNRASLSYPNTVTTSYSYDSLNRLRELATVKGSGPGAVPVQSYHLAVGPSGNRTQIVESRGLPQQRTLDFGYDDLYRLTNETVSELMGAAPALSYQKTFVYDDVGNRNSQTTTLGPLAPAGIAAGVISYGYDERDRLLTERPGTDPAVPPAVSYGWDANGNLTSKSADGAVLHLGRREPADPRRDRPGREPHDRRARLRRRRQPRADNDDEAWPGGRGYGFPGRHLRRPQPRGGRGRRERRRAEAQDPLHPQQRRADRPHASARRGSDADAGRLAVALLPCRLHRLRPTADRTRPARSPTATPTPPSVNSSLTRARTRSPTLSPASRSIRTPAGSTTEPGGWTRGWGGSLPATSHRPHRTHRLLCTGTATQHRTPSILCRSHRVLLRIRGWPLGDFEFEYRQRVSSEY